MPLHHTAQNHSWVNMPPFGIYKFVDKQRPQWEAFWREMEGDIDKIAEFAQKSEVPSPYNWVEQLHRFLFDTFSGDPRLMKYAAKKNFGEFLKQVVENHINDPRERAWYASKGVQKRDYISTLERASLFEKPDEAIVFINARIIDMGAKLYSEYVLSKTPQSKEIVSIASKLNKQAYKIEQKITGKVIPFELKAGDEIKHARFPGEKFTVLEIDSEEDPFLVVRDAENKVGYITDVWNVSV